MKRYLAILWILLAAIISTTTDGYAQMSATVADGSNTNNYIPIAGQYADGIQHQQVIYPGTLLSDIMGSTISSMTFYLSSLPANSWNCTFSVRLGSVDAASFPNTAFLPVDNTVEVYTGILSIDAVSRQLTINFTTPFNYTGGGLLLDVQNTEGGIGSMANFLGINSSSSALNSFSFFGNVFGPSSQSFLPKTTFTYTGGSSCITPTDFHVEHVDATTATLSWHPRSENMQYQVCCVPSGTDLANVEWILVSDTLYTFNNLVSNTLYTSYVRNYCGTEVSGVASISFHTECGAVISEFPWTEGFEEDWELCHVFGQQNMSPQCWRIYNGGTTAHSSGDGSYFWKINQSATQVHSGQHSAVCYTEYALAGHNDWLISPMLGLSGNQKVSFYVQNNVSNTSKVDEISVWISEENATLQEPANNMDAMPGFTQLFQSEVPIGAFQLFEVSLEGYNGNRHIAFVRRNTPNDGWYLCLDDVTVDDILPCAIPTDLSAISAADNAKLTWTAESDTVNLYYKISVSEEYTVIQNVSLNEDSVYVLSNLIPATSYDWYVEAICDDQSLMPSAVASFSTTCAAISTVPRLWDFEGNNEGGTTAYPLPVCWERQGSQTYPYVVNDPYVAHGGEKCLFRGGLGANVLAILPQLDVQTLPLHTLQIRFFAKEITGIESAIEVGLMTDPLDISTYTTVQVFSNLTANYMEYEVNFANISSDAEYIVFKLNAPNGSLYLDDIVLEEIPPCDRPTNLYLSNITSNSAILHWTTTMEESKIYYQEAGTGAYVVTDDSPVSDMVYTLHNLTPNTSYSVYVSSVCLDGTEMASSILSFVSDCIALDTLPYSCDFENDNTSGTPIYPLPACWSSLNAAAPALYVSNVSSMAHSGVHSLYSVRPVNFVVSMPTIDNSSLSLGSLMLSFYAKSNYGRSAMVEVGVLANPIDVSTFESIASFNLTSNYQQIEVLFDTYYGDGRNIAFRMNASNDYVVIDDVVLEVAPPCPKPTNFKCVSTSSTEVTLTWNPGRNENQWELAYGEVGFNPDNATMVMQLNNNVATIGNLSNTTAYDFYVRAICGGENGFSGWQSILALVPGSYKMRTFGTDTLYTCGATIFDDGGATGDYSPNCESYLVIYPSEEQSYVEISGTLMAESSMWDYLVVYDGVGTGRVLYRSSQDGSSVVNIPSTTSTTGPLTIYFHSDGSVCDDGFVINTSCITCVKPALTVAQVGLGSIALTWNHVASAISYELAYGPVGVNPDSVQTVTVVDASSYTISSLSPNTSYDVYIRTQCDETSHSAWSNAVTVSTLPFAPAILPYNCDFENGSVNALWTIENGNQFNKWYIQNAVNNTNAGDSALYISMDAGATNSYRQDGAASNVWAYRDFQFPDGAEFLLSFDWLGYGEGFNSYLFDYLSIYIGTPMRVEAGSESAPSGAVLLANLCHQPSWTTAEYVLGAEYANTTQRLYFVWRNDDTEGANPPAAIDNISLRTVNCAQPVALTVNEVTATTANISITAADEQHVAWQLKCGPDMLITVTEDTSYLLTGLTPAEVYEVRARSICSDGDSSRWTPVSTFVTACHTIGASSIPYSCDFETNNYGGSSVYPLPVCWNRLGSANYPFVYTSQQAYSGNNSLCSGDDPINYIAVLPEINTAEITINSLQLSFFAKVVGYEDCLYMLEVGVMTDPNDASTFNPVDTITNLTSAYSEQEVVLDHYMEEGSFLAFRINASGSYSSYGYYSAAVVYIDDVVVSYIPPCQRPRNLTCVGNTLSAVTITWTPSGNENEWAVAVGNYGFNPQETGIVQVTQSNVFVLNNLTIGEAYDIYVRANCGEEGNSRWQGPLTVIPGTVRMKTTGTDTIHACDVVIYDDGGLFDNYSDGCDAYLVVYPDQPGHYVEINGTLTAEYSDYDYLIIYDGVGAGQVLFASEQEENVPYTISSVISSTGPLTIYFHSDYVNNYSGFVLNVSCASCVAPILSLSSFYMDSVVVSWTGSSPDASYELVYGPQGFMPGTATPIVVAQDTSYVLTGLTPNTTYEAYIRMQCDENEYSSWSNAISFTTLAHEPARIPYACDFENGTERDAWVFQNGGQPNKWYINAVEEENNVMFVSGDGGQSNMYIQTESSHVWAYREFQVGEQAELVLSFDWRCQGESMNGSNYDYLKLFVGDVVPVQAGSNTISGNVVQLDLLNMQGSWTHAEYSLGNVEEGAIKRLYFLWSNDNTEGSNPAAAIDNIEIKAIHCAQPVSVRAENITSQSARVVVTYADENAVGWQLQYGNGDPVTVMNDTVLEIHDLAPATMYEMYARSICANGDTSVWTSCSFITECELLGVSSLPYFCDFETNNIAGTSSRPLPVCWDRSDAEYPYVDVFSYGAHSGIRYLYSGGNANDLFVILPEINTDELLISQLQLGFYAKISDFSGSIDVGVMTDPSNLMSFVPMGSVSTLTQTYAEYEVPLSQYSGNGSYIAMRLNSVGGTGNYGEELYALLYIDDITLGYIPDCPYPTSLNQSNITSMSADLTWSDVASTYIVYYREAGTTDYIEVSEVSLTNGVYTLTGLDAATNYEWYVASVCDNGNVVPSHIRGSFKTLCNIITDYPYQETFNTDLGCWRSSVLAGDEWQWQIDNEYGEYESPIGAAEGSHFAMANYYYYGNAYRLASPVFDLSSMENPYLKFYHIQQDYEGDQDVLKIYYKTSAEAEPVLIVSYDNSIYPWQLDSMALPNPTATYQLLFDAHLDWGYGVGVDNVIVYDGGGDEPVVELPVVVTNAASNITAISAILHGTITNFGNQTITSRGFEWKLTNNGAYVQELAIGTTAEMIYILSGLADNTSYTYRAFVSTADTTVYGAEMPFVTLNNTDICVAPTGLQVTNITGTTAEVSWTAGADEESWVVEHKLQTESDWHVQSVNTAQVMLADLTPGSSYQVRVKAVCGEAESNYAETSFTTSVGICNVDDEQYILLMPNPADNHIVIYIKGNMIFETAEIYNTMGQRIQMLQLQDQHTEINLENMVSGLYFVRFRSEQGIVTKKFIKR